MLIRILNYSDNIFDEGLGGIVDNIRKSYSHKIVLRFDPKYTVEDHMNAGSLLSELVEYKSIYQELVSQRNLEKLEEFLQSDSDSSKTNIYIMLGTIVQKYKSNEQFSKRIITSYDEDEAMDDDEVMLEFNNQEKESELFSFLQNVIEKSDSIEMDIPHEDHQGNQHEYSYGICKKPFGILRMRIVEFLAQLYQVFYKEIH